MNKNSTLNNKNTSCINAKQRRLNILQHTQGKGIHVQLSLNAMKTLKKTIRMTPKAILIMLTETTALVMSAPSLKKIKFFLFLIKPCKVAYPALNKPTNHSISTENQPQLTQQKQALEYELKLAQMLLSKVIPAYKNIIPELNSYESPMEHVGGDFILSYLHPSNTLYIMLGDVSGHGLPAAIAASLITGAFVTLSAENYGIESILQSINGNMCTNLPTGLYCAALLVQIDLPTKTLKIWQGGLPDAYLIGSKGNIIETLNSRNLPLGILADQDFSGTAVHYTCDDIHSLFACSDGATEYTNQHEEMFGVTRLLESLQHSSAQINRVDHVIQQLELFRANSPRSDDLSLFELDISALTQRMT